MEEKHSSVSSSCFGFSQNEINRNKKRKNNYSEYFPHLSSIPSSSSTTNANTVNEKNVCAIQIDKKYEFKYSLRNIFYEGKVIPPSASPCYACKKKNVLCICDAFQLIGKTNSYVIDELTEVRKNLNKVRTDFNLNNLAEFKDLANRMDSVQDCAVKSVKCKKSNFCNSELVTSSWLKLYEVLHVGNILKSVLSCRSSFASSADLKEKEKKNKLSFFSVHICERPGSFVCATNHFIKTKFSGIAFDWRAISFNPFFEGNENIAMSDNDIFFCNTYNKWLTGIDDSGNIISKENIESIWNFTSKNKERALLADFVTGNGGIDAQCSENELEENSAQIHFSELVCALGLLKVGGRLLLRMFTFFKHHSLSILSIFSMCFKKVFVVKGRMSKSEESEVFILGLDFLGIRSNFLKALINLISEEIPRDKAIVPRKWIPEEFYREFIVCSKYFSELQISAIKFKFDLFSNENFKVRDFEKQCLEEANELIFKLKIDAINHEDEILSQTNFRKYFLTTEEIFVFKRDQELIEQPRKSDFQCSFKEIQKRRAEIFHRSEGLVFPKFFYLVFEQNVDRSFSSKQENDFELAALDIEGLIPKNNMSMSKSINWLFLDVIEGELDTLKLQKESICNSDIINVINKKEKDGKSNVKKCVNDTCSTKKLFLAAIRGHLNAKTFAKQNWIYSSLKLDPCNFKSSYFADHELLNYLIYLRLQLPDSLTPICLSDCILLESSIGNALSDLSSLPSSTSVDMCCVFNMCIAEVEGAEGRDKYDCIGYIRKKYKKYVEISVNNKQEFPCVCFLKRLGIDGYIVYYNNENYFNFHEYLEDLVKSEKGIDKKERKCQKDHSKMSATNSEDEFINVFPEFNERSSSEEQEIKGNNESFNCDAAEGCLLNANNSFSIQKRNIEHFLKNVKNEENVILINSSEELKVLLADFPGNGKILNCKKIDFFKSFFSFIEKNVHQNTQNTYFPSKSLTEVIDNLLQGIRYVCDFVFIDAIGSQLYFSEFFLAEQNIKLNLVAQIIQALTCISNKGDLLLRIGTTYSRFTVNILIIFSCLFEKITIVRPKTLSSFTCIRYVFCKNFIDNMQDVGRYFFRYLYDEIYKVEINNYFILYKNKEFKNFNEKRKILDVLQFLPPVFFTAPVFAQWMFSVNNELLEEEIKDLELRLKNSNNFGLKSLFKNSQKRQAIFQTFLKKSAFDEIFSGELFSQKLSFSKNVPLDENFQLNNAKKHYVQQGKKNDQKKKINKCKAGGWDMFSSSDSSCEGEMEDEKEDKYSWKDNKDENEIFENDKSEDDNQNEIKSTNEEEIEW